jgi:hypothetical protein
MEDTVEAVETVAEVVISSEDYATLLRFVTVVGIVTGACGMVAGQQIAKFARRKMAERRQFRGNNHNPKSK